NLRGSGRFGDAGEDSIPLCEAKYAILSPHFSRPTPFAPPEKTLFLPRTASIAPIVVRSLKGTLRGPDYLPGQSQPRLSLDLLEGNSGRRLKSLETTDSGEFNFESAAPGLYFLSLKTSGLIAVAVDPGALTDYLDVDLGGRVVACGTRIGVSVHRANCKLSSFPVRFSTPAGR